VLAVVLVPGVKARFSHDTGRDLGGEYEGGRVYIWENSLAVIAEHPLLGVGPGFFKEVYAKRLPADIDEVRKVSTAHNELLNFAAVAGIPAALLYLLLWAVVAWRFWRTYRAAVRSGDGGGQAFALAALSASLAFFVTSMFHSAFIDEEVRHVLMFFWGLGFAAAYKNETSTAGEPI
jgi:O-antigen ligase